jgi:hypothetical protein
MSHRRVWEGGGKKRILLVIFRYGVEAGAVVRVPGQGLGRWRRTRVSIRHAGVTRRSVLVRRRTAVHRLLATLFQPKEETKDTN